MSDTMINIVLEPEDEYHKLVAVEIDRNGLTGVGMSECLDQMVDGWPTGPDVPPRESTEEVGA